MNRTVSILIDNYNYARFLRQAIDSALAQTYPHTEVVVVDDGSTDESADVIRSYGERVRAVFKKNGGQASAFNAGFARSSGQIVAFLDADDYFLPTTVERIVSLWKEDTAILHHRLQVVDQAGQPAGYYPPLPGPLDSGDVLSLLLRQGGYTCPATTGLVYSRAILDQVLPIPEESWRLCADTFLSTATPFFGEVTTLEEPLACYRVHGSNNFGPAHTLTRRTLTRADVKRTTEYTRQRYALIGKMAAERGLPIADFVLNGVCFGELLLHRAGATTDGPKKGVGLYGDLLKHLWSEPGVSLRQRLQKTVMGFVIWLGPRSLLRLIYPRMFTEPA